MKLSNSIAAGIQVVFGTIVIAIAASIFFESRIYEITEQLIGMSHVPTEITTEIGKYFFTLTLALAITAPFSIFALSLLTVVYRELIKYLNDPWR